MSRRGRPLPARKLCVRPGSECSEGRHTAVTSFDEPHLRSVESGRNIELHVRYADGRAGRYALLARELAELPVDVVFAQGTQAVRALQGVTDALPVVALMGDAGVALASDSLSRPTNNITGFSTLANLLTLKRVDLLKEVVPSLTRIGVLIAPANPANTEAGIRERLRPAADTLGVSVISLEVVDNDLRPAFERMARGEVEAVVVGAEPSFFERRSEIATFMATRAIPAIYSQRDYVIAGGLMSYAPDYNELGRRAAQYVQRVLRGAHPADLPIQQAERIELLINLQAATALGLKVPPTLLARADEVIE